MSNNALMASIATVTESVTRFAAANLGVPAAAISLIPCYMPGQQSVCLVSVV